MDMLMLLAAVAAAFIIGGTVGSMVTMIIVIGRLAENGVNSRPSGQEECGHAGKNDGRV